MVRNGFTIENYYQIEKFQDTLNKSESNLVITLACLIFVLGLIICPVLHGNFLENIDQIIDSNEDF